MSDFGIICEVNPLHGGHRYLIESARSMGAERVVCVMSGNTVQRGEFAVTDKYARAEMLIANGADLVLELPFPWSAASAEQFARGGISVLREVCDTIIFGSECGDLSGLMAAAEKAGSEEFRVAFLESLKRGDGSAESYYRLLGDDFSSNDLLGIDGQFIFYISVPSCDVAVGAGCTQTVFDGVDDTGHGAAAGVSGDSEA